MDDLLIFTPSKKSQIAKLKDLLKALLKNGLKISPKKCQLFRTELQYMGITIFIQDRRVKQDKSVKPLRSRLEVIQKLQLPTTVRNVDVSQECELFKYILSGITKSIKVYILFNKKREAIHMRGNTRGSI